ncbi:MAG: GH25 family lysozyme [Chthoniobacter sp.]
MTAFQQELSDYMEVVRSFYGREPVVYTANDFRDYFLRDFPIKELWIRSVVTSPQLSDHAPWRLWQFSEKGRVPGISGFVDQNVFHGNAEAFESFIHRGQ